MTIGHATETDVLDWISTEAAEGLVDGDIDRMIARASELVDHTVRAAHDPDPVADVLRDATCAVIEAWLEVGETNDVDGLAGTQVSVAGYSGFRAPSIPPRAYRILAAAGLTQPSDTPGTVW